MPYYGAGLAFIHDAGFRDYALAAAPGLLQVLGGHGIRRGLVADLGCGTGQWAAELTGHGYQALGIDRSSACLRLARANAPAARFRAGSLWTAALPPCSAVTSIGECINYADESRTPLVPLFRRIRRALTPGGLWIFDAAGPSRMPANGPRRTWRGGDDWAVLAESQGRGRTLARRIVCWRRVGALYRRSEETHCLRLYSPNEVLRALGAAGFEAEPVAAFGAFRLPEGITGYIAHL